MRNILLIIIFMLRITTALAQGDSLGIEGLNEPPSPIIIAYQNEAQALTFQKEKSPYYSDISSLFKLQKAGNLRKEATLVTSFNLPALWKDKEVFITFAPRKTTFQLLINEKEVALIAREVPVKVNVTSFLNENENVIALRAIDGSVLNSKSISSIILTATPKVSVVDLYFYQYNNPLPSKETDWSVHLGLKYYSDSPYELAYNYRYTLYDSNLKQVEIGDLFRNEHQKLLRNDDLAHIGIHYGNGNFSKWNCETPNLYYLTLKVTTPNDEVVQVVSTKIGFRVVSLRQNKIHLGNKPLSVPITLNPVTYRIYLSPDSLYTPENLRNFLISLKKHNVNTIMLSDGLINTNIYELCDELGLYIIQRIDFPNHADISRLSAEERIKLISKFRTKVVAKVNTLKNHPSIIALSFNRELILNDPFQSLIDTIKEVEEHRLFIYQNSKIDNHVPVVGRQIPDWHNLSERQRLHLKKRYQPVYFWIDEMSMLHLTNKYDFTALDNVVLS